MSGDPIVPIKAAETKRVLLIRNTFKPYFASTTGYVKICTVYMQLVYKRHIRISWHWMHFSVPYI